jgi:hypothetical protein
LIRSSAGPVINVVTRAINTIIANISGDKIPRSYPIFSTISSIKPLVFINAPIDKLFFQFSPTILAASALPPNFPATATIITSPQVIHKCPSFSNPISVRKPVKTKNSGSNKTRLTSSILSTTIFLKLKSGGIITPARKAPNNACIPMISVVYADISIIMKIIASTGLLTIPRFA